MDKQGRLIVLEGTDGSGKSTQFQLLCRRLEARVQAGQKDVFQTITREDMEQWAALFQEPDEEELAGHYAQ